MLSDSKDIIFLAALRHLAYNFLTYFAYDFTLVDTGEIVE